MTAQFVRCSECGIRSTGWTKAEALERHRKHLNEEHTCGDTDNGLSLIGCTKKPEHYGERHGYSNVGGMSAAWGFLEEENA